MTECTRGCLVFSSVKRRLVETKFPNSDLTSDGGLLFQHIDKQQGKRELCLKSRKYSLHNPHLNLTTQICPAVTNLAQNQ